MKFVRRFFILYVLSFLTDGKAYTLPYEKHGGACRNGSTEYSPTGSNLCCSRCKPGFRLLTECTASKDTVCEECQKGMYSDTMNFYPNCFRCNVCDENKKMVYTRTCTSISNSDCACRPGWFCFLQLGSQPCSQCKKHLTCPPGKGAKSPGTHKTNIKCIGCPEGTFSNETNSEPCRPHTQCEAQGRAVLHRGSSTTDTVCENLKSAPTRHLHTTTQTTQLYVTSPTPTGSDLVTETLPATRPKHKSSVLSDNVVLYSVLAAVMLLLVLLTVTFVICHRKGLRKPPVTEDVQAPDCKMESELLLGDGKTSTSSASSTSDSQSTGASQESIHTEQPVVSSPCVNFSFTATINCQLNQPPGSCAIPICPTNQPQPQPQPQPESQPQPQPQPELQPQSDLPLSQEEQLRVSCEEENSKDALQSVQESGMTVY
ncbi:tumor necrosis factor receptor superfamily member 1B [Salminus brasiliensis]|uniref:tumor necrosis factor receptor superfamily member 1B n=1 Tax=Salminus brasiliensis TaxID=930266 RepID=UPI003B82EF1A